MDTSAQIFFIISSVGFVVLWALVAVLLFYFIRVMHIFSRMMQRVEHDLEKIDEAAKDILLDIHESTIFRFIFGKKRKSRK